MKKQTAKTLKAFGIELVIYSILVLGYFLLILHFIGDWLYQLEMHHRYAYAAVAILLIAGQAVLLEMVTTFLLQRLSGRSE